MVLTTASRMSRRMLAPLTEMGAAQHPLLGQLGLSSFDLWRSQAKGALWEEGLRFDGGIYIGADEAAAVALQRAAALLGRAAQPLNPKQWRKHSGFSAPIAHALLVEEEGIADPVRVLSGLAMDARRHGVQLLYDHDVDTVEANRVTVFQRGVFEADVVVLAPGAWANASLQGAAPALKHLRPARGHMVP